MFIISNVCVGTVWTNLVFVCMPIVLFVIVLFDGLSLEKYINLCEYSVNNEIMR